MRFSLKILLLLTALFAVTIAWLNARSVYLDAQHSSAANSTLRATTIREKIGGNSYIRVDPNGDVRSLNVAGPEGYRALDKHTRAGETIEHLCIRSQYAFEHFRPKAFSSLTELYLADFQVDSVDLDQLSESQSLSMLGLHTKGPPAIAVLSTLPRDSPIRKIQILSTETGDISEFPFLPNLRSLVIDVPSLQREQIDELRRKLPDCDIYYSDPRSP